MSHPDPESIKLIVTTGETSTADFTLAGATAETLSIDGTFAMDETETAVIQLARISGTGTGTVGASTTNRFSATLVW